ncbi:MAG TPA: ANTAR domain-containing protein [Mycobacteriales bacterium]|nr:ANTAR domain-containing protein [Mycobacteriales bacterium]
MGVPTLSVRSDWRRPGYVVMHVAGEIDIATVGQVDDELSDLLVRGCRYLVVDLSMTGFCDASGLSSFVLAQGRVRARRGWLRLVGPQPIVRKLFQVAGLAGEFSFFDTLELATSPHRAGPTRPGDGHQVPEPRQPAGRPGGRTEPAGGGPAGSPASARPGPSRAVRWSEVASRFAEIAGTLPPHESIHTVLQQVVALARRTVPGADGAGLRLVGRPRVGPAVSAGDLGAAAEVLQDELGDGPSVRAGSASSAVYVHDLAGRTGWPAFCDRADRLGVGSLLCYPLATGRAVPGVLTLYARRANAFDAAAREVGEVFASHATVAIAGALAELQLRQALRVKDVIGQAVGVVMERQGVSSEQAFDLLRRASQASHVRLPHLAHQVVSTTPVLVPAAARVEVPDSFADL